MFSKTDYTLQFYWVWNQFNGTDGKIMKDFIVCCDQKEISNVGGVVFQNLF